MERIKLEQILEEQGWLNTNKTNLTPGNNSEYIEWSKNNVLCYVGNYYIEIETQAVSYPYKDEDSNEVELLKFLNLPNDKKKYFKIKS